MHALTLMDIGSQPGHRLLDQDFQGEPWKEGEAGGLGLDPGMSGSGSASPGGRAHPWRGRLFLFGGDESQA
jgi:hypothetical protein